MYRHNAPHVWLQAGRAIQLPDAISGTFDEYVSALPWAGTTGLDWSRMPPSSSFNLVGKSATETYEWVKTTSLGRHSHVGIWYSRMEGGIVVPLRTGVESLDELYCGPAGPRFAFGVEVVDGEVRAFFADLLQYGYGDLLVAIA